MKDGLNPRHTPASLGVQHSVIAYASSPNEPLSQDLGALNLPCLASLLGKMTCVSQGFTPMDLQGGKQSEAAYLMPHESVLSLWGLSPQWGPEAIITPCHWQVGGQDLVSQRLREKPLRPRLARRKNGHGGYVRQPWVWVFSGSRRVR